MESICNKCKRCPPDANGCGAHVLADVAIAKHADVVIGVVDGRNVVFVKCTMYQTKDT